MNISRESLRIWTRRHPRWVVAVGLISLSAGMLLIWEPWQGRVPDPGKAPLRDASAFLRDSRFLSLTSNRREAYIADLSRRYLTASSTDRKLIDQELVPGSAIMRPLQRQLGMALVRKALDGYGDLPADQRAERLAALRAFVAGMGFRSSAAAPLTPGAPDPVAQAADTQDGFRQGLARFKRDLLDGGLDARDRAALADITEDLRRSKQ